MILAAPNRCATYENSPLTAPADIDECKAPETVELQELAGALARVLDLGLIDRAIQELLPVLAKTEGNDRFRHVGVLLTLVRRRQVLSGADFVLGPARLHEVPSTGQRPK